MDFRSLRQEFVIMILLLLLQNCFTYAFDYDDDNDSSSRCPWIRNKLRNGRVKIRSRGRIAKFLCDSGYELAGKRFATCVRGQWNNPIPVCVARGCPKLPEPANGRVTEMYRGALLIYDCLPGYVLDGDMSVYCDGRRWNTSLPACVVAKESPSMSCDFENPDLCGWNHDPTHDFNWQRNQHSTPSGHVGTGPSFDHTYGEGKGGYYLYIEASSPRKVNDTSRIFSPVFPMDYSGGCFSFWYHMYGSTTGGLRVYIRPESSVFDEVSPTWEKFGDQGNQWLSGNISVPYFDQNFQIVIEGIRGTSYIGDTAIDDVAISPTGCDAIGNGTESSIELSADSCRGRCLGREEMIGCGCDDSCYPDNCCSDYQLICTSGSSWGSDNPEELPAGDTLPTTVMLSTIGSSTEQENPPVDTSEVITHSESSMTEFVSDVPTETSAGTFFYTDYPSTLSENILTANYSTEPFNEQTNVSVDTSTQNATAKDATISRYFSTFSLIVSTDSLSPVPTDSSAPVSTSSSSSISNYNSSVISSSTINTESSSVTSAIVTDSSSAISADSSSYKTISTVKGSNFSTTEMLTTPTEESKILIDNLTTVFINTIKLRENATSSGLLPTTEPITISSSIAQTASEVPDNFSSAFGQEFTSSIEASDKVAYTSETTRRTYNLRPRTKKTTATEWAEGTTVPLTFSKLDVSTNTNKETIILKSTPPVIYRYTSILSNTDDGATVGSNMKTTETSSMSSSEDTNDVSVQDMHPSARKNTLLTEKYVNTKPYMYSTKATSSHTAPVDNSASRSASAAVKSESVVTIVSVVLVIVGVFVGGWIFIVRRKRAKRQSKLSDDSELRYLQANEISDY